MSAACLNCLWICLLTCLCVCCQLVCVCCQLVCLFAVCVSVCQFVCVCCQLVCVSEVCLSVCQLVCVSACLNTNHVVVRCRQDAAEDRHPGQADDLGVLGRQEPGRAVRHLRQGLPGGRGVPHAATPGRLRLQGHRNRFKGPPGLRVRGLN